jgi:hypothetical protein
MMLKEKIEWKSLCRDTAVIITNDGSVYEDINHQYCLQSFQDEYLKDYDLGDDSDLAEAIKLTDYLFREGFIHGFDVFTDYENRKIFASHYMRAFDEPKVRAAAEKYAEENGCILTTFTDAETLGKEMRLVA